ncbi:MAG: hypothetical protein NVS1B13_12110 [Flavisolibacter sp.]
MKFLFRLVFVFVATVLQCCTNSANPVEKAEEGDKNKVTTLGYRIMASTPHDTSYFTEGLEFYNNSLLESTGNYGKSKLVQTELQSGRPLRQVSLDKKYFGEGITVLRDTLYQLTWKEHTVMVYQAKNFKKIKELPFNAEGWGMTNDGKSLIASDGSSNLYFYEPSTFKLQHVQAVTENGSPAININELEYINGFIYANQWQLNYILKINPATGEVVGKMDLTDLINKMHLVDPQDAVLNGIAYNPLTQKVYITGKNWPQLFEIQFDH